MATITLVANTNYSALTVASGDTIALNGFRLTLDVATPSAINVTVTAVGNAGTVADSTPTLYTLTGWTFRAGTATLYSITFGKSITGATFIASTDNGADCVSANTGNNTFTNCTFVGGSVFGANGIGNLSNSTFVNCTFIGGSVSGAHGFASGNASQHTIDSTNYAEGGSVSGAYGLSIGGFGVIDSPTLSTSVAGAYALNNNGRSPVVLDVRKLTGVCVNQASSVSNIVSYGGTSTANYDGLSGTLRTVPAPDDVRSGVSVMGETGTLAGSGGVPRSRAFGGAM